MLCAFVAGSLAGLVLTALQLAITSPIIMAAEIYETGADAGAGSTLATRATHGIGDHRHTPGTYAHALGAEWAPADGLQRHAFTGLATIVTSIGFCLALTALMVIRGGAIDGRRGFMWGLGGFAAVTLAPSLGLAPELPGSAGADLDARQLWWAGTALATAVGLALMVFTTSWVMRLLGVAVVAAPHLIGAPMPDQYTSTAPAELAGEFAAASIALGAVFWSLLGWTTGTFWQRLTAKQVAPG